MWNYIKEGRAEKKNFILKRIREKMVERGGRIRKKKSLLCAVLCVCLS